MNRSQLLTLATVNLSNGIASFDTGVINLILPTISITLQAPVELVFWVPLVGLITRAAFMPIFGRYADIHGRKKQLLSGLFLFSVGSILSGYSSTIYELILYRAIQGIGASSILAVGRAILIDVTSPREGGFAIGTNVSAIYIFTTIGTAISGSIISLTSITGWSSIFIGTGLFALIIIPLAFFTVGESRTKDAVDFMDWPGSLLFALAISFGLISATAAVISNFGILHFFIEYVRIPFLNLYIYTRLLISIPVYWLGLMFLFFLLFFLFQERTAKVPLLNFKLFSKNLVFALTNLTAFFVYVSTFSIPILLSFYLQLIRGLPAILIGLILAINPLAIATASIVGGGLSSRIQKRKLEFAGLLVMAISIYCLSFTGINTPLVLIGLFLAIEGIGFGIFAPSNTTLSLTSVDGRIRSLANGILGMMRHSGQAISLGVATVTLDIFLTGGTKGGTFSAHDYLVSLDSGFLISVVLLVIVSITYLYYYNRITLSELVI